MTENLNVPPAELREPLLEDQLQAITDYVSSQVQNLPPHMNEDYGIALESRQAESFRTAKGTVVSCSSLIAPGESAPFQSVIYARRYGLNERLLIAGDGSFYAAADQDDNDLYEVDALNLEQASQDSNFQQLVARMYHLISDEVHQPKRELTQRPLTEAALVVEADQPTATSGFAERALEGQDAALLDKAHNVYGVFDGLGEHRASGTAARLAAATIQEYMQEISTDDPEQVLAELINAVGEAQEAILTWQNAGEKGTTTAAVAKLIEGASTDALLWASVGDSRIYVQSPDGGLRQISQDENARDKDGNVRASVIVNAIGAPNFSGVNHYGIVALEKGSTVLICSDGITGDKGEELLTDDEINSALSNAPHDASAAAQALVEIARKHDDRMAVVIRN